MMVDLLIFSIIWVLSGVGAAYWFLKYVKKDNVAISELEVSISGLFVSFGVFGLLAMCAVVVIPKIANYLNDKL